jgi:hypothetical protein
MADEYLSRRILDSVTMKSEKRRTRSASVVVEASLMANDRNLSIDAVANSAALWLTIASFDGDAATDEDRRDASAITDPEADLACGGGVGRDFGTAAWLPLGCR